MCTKLRTNPCMHFGLLFSLWCHPWARLVDSVCLLIVSLPSPGRSILPPGCYTKLCECCLIFHCGSLYLFTSAVDEAFQETVMIGSILQAEQSIMNNIRDWLSHMGCISSWYIHWLDVPSVSAPFFPCISHRQDKFLVEGFVGILMSPSLPL